MRAPTALHFLAHQLMDSYAFDVKGLAQRLHVPLESFEATLASDTDNPRLYESLVSLAAQLDKADGVCLSIRHLREAMALRRNQLASLVGLQTISLQKIERGDNLPSLATTRALWGVFSTFFPNLKAEDFFCGHFDEVLTASMATISSELDRMEQDVIARGENQ